MINSASIAVYRSAALFLLVVVCAFSTGCTIGPVKTDNRTGGLAVNMEVRLGEDSIAMYDVDTDGTIEFAGGKSAILGRTDWSGELTDDEIVRLRALVLKEHDWFGSMIRSTNQPQDMKYTIRVRGVPGQLRFTVLGENDRIAPVRELLEHAAGRRNAAVLDAMPRPGVETLGE